MKIGMKTSWKYPLGRILRLSFVVILCAAPLLVLAQAGGWGGSGTNIVDAPIDGGISILLAAGIGYGAKKLYNKRLKK